jgi:hypothetical protein
MGRSRDEGADLAHGVECQGDKRDSVARPLLAAPSAPGVPTATNFFLALEVAIGHSQASGQPLSLLWVQIDGCSETQ